MMTNFGFLPSGGDGGSRTHVRKSIPETFYERSLSFEIPSENAGKQALIFGSPLNRDKLQDSHLFTCTAK